MSSSSASPPPPEGRRRAFRTAASIILVALVATGGYLVVRHEPARATEAATPPASTAQLERRDLSTGQTLTGQVGYGTAFELTGRGGGTVTWLPEPGATVTLGQSLYRNDDQPVALFYGRLPLYRPLSEVGLVGRDVKIVADNLEALGYDIGSGTGASPGSVRGADRSVTGSGEAVLTADLKAAIRRWQEDTGREPTGGIEIGDVEVRSGPVRVESVLVQTGAEVEQPLLGLTSTGKAVTVMATMTEAGGINRGDRVDVVLPDGSDVAGKVTGKGRVLTASSGSGVPGGSDEAQKLAVTITLDRLKPLAKIDAADVEVTFTARTIEDALVAPVEALVSLREGGYAVEPADGRGLIGVETGMFADGMVEVSGSGLAEGLSVVVAQ
ncbi:efflux RND transporter periplasmic adaptor subunit [Kineosporia succinea]|uniref:Multidrug efflux pump subunit AcrA (Membrane-fusion protein) n=1 Tax=Kineosporia succinea TaxID=84632 RepID=A0ABT9PDY2_9ACTN|nr:hypothetical protein [Kineosporia succinea]MDP9830701.1 hypothetical protein [Kineosporia succinea]